MSKKIQTSCNVFADEVRRAAQKLPMQLAIKLRETKGQGTTEYAILVGVLVVIAIVAVLAFKDKLQELWEGIAQGINSL